MNQPVVTLREINAHNICDVIDLELREDQEDFVASNAYSMAQAMFAPEAWYRAVYAGEEVVGFIMLEDETQLSPPPADPQISVWRFMIDQRFQGRGYGRQVMLQIIEHARSRGFARLLLAYVPGKGSPEPLYRGLGFRPTGVVDEDGEVEMVLDLGPSPRA